MIPSGPPGDLVPPGDTVSAGEAVPPVTGLPPGDTVDVWWSDIRAVTVGPAGLADLDPGERNRAEAFLFPADRHRYQVAHIALRRVLAGYTGTAPGRLRLGRERCPRCGGPSGRPVLLPGQAGCPVPAFSLAHSGDMVVIAVAARPVGVDVEQDDAARCLCSLAGELHPADAAWVAGLGWRERAERDRHQAIITCWVRAEAVLKCTGQGIGHGLGGFPVRPGQAAGLSVNGCTVRQLPAPAGYQAAVALAGTSPPAPRIMAASATRAG
jgi:4'-phosphopantetheinyl transferase